MCPDSPSKVCPFCTRFKNKNFNSNLEKYSTLCSSMFLKHFCDLWSTKYIYYALVHGVRRSGNISPKITHFLSSHEASKLGEGTSSSGKLCNQPLALWKTLRNQNRRNIVFSLSFQLHMATGWNGWQLWATCSCQSVYMPQLSSSVQLSSDHSIPRLSA